MKKLLPILLAFALFSESCGSNLINTVVNKQVRSYDVNGYCQFEYKAKGDYLNTYFMDSCYKYSVGDTIIFQKK